MNYSKRFKKMVGVKYFCKKCTQLYSKRGDAERCESTPITGPNIQTGFVFKEIDEGRGTFYFVVFAYAHALQKKHSRRVRLKKIEEGGFAKNMYDKDWVSNPNTTSKIAALLKKPEYGEYYHVSGDELKRLQEILDTHNPNLEFRLTNSLHIK